MDCFGLLYAVLQPPLAVTVTEYVNLEILILFFWANIGKAPQGNVQHKDEEN